MSKILFGLPILFVVLSMYGYPLACGQEGSLSPVTLSIEEMVQLHGGWERGKVCTFRNKCVYYDSSCSSDINGDGYPDCINLPNYTSYYVTDYGCYQCRPQVPNAILMECKLGPERQYQCGTKYWFSTLNCAEQNKLKPTEPVYTYNCYQRRAS